MQIMTEILVVDDDTAMINVLRDFLKHQGYQVATASSVASAEKWLSLHAGPSQKPDIVLSDVRLGTASGIDLAQRLRITNPSLPVILFSVFEEHEQEALNSGARRFLRKPFSLSSLQQVIKDELRKK